MRSRATTSVRPRGHPSVLMQRGGCGSPTRWGAAGVRSRATTSVRVPPVRDSHLEIAVSSQRCCHQLWVLQLICQSLEHGLPPLRSSAVSAACGSEPTFATMLWPRPRVQRVERVIHCPKCRMPRSLIQLPALSQLTGLLSYNTSIRTYVLPVRAYVRDSDPFPVKWLSRPRHAPTAPNTVPSPFISLLANLPKLSSTHIPDVRTPSSPHLPKTKPSLPNSLLILYARVEGVLAVKHRLVKLRNLARWFPRIVLEDPPLPADQILHTSPTHDPSRRARPHLPLLQSVLIHKLFQNLLVKRTSRSLTSVSGNSCKRTTSRRNLLATSEAVSVVLHGTR